MFKLVYQILKNLPTKVELQSDYEVIAQFQFYDALDDRRERVYLEMTRDNY